MVNTMMETEAFKAFNDEKHIANKYKVIHTPNLINDNLSIYEHKNDGVFHISGN